METIAKIRRLYYGEGKKIKTIARDLRISKNTVKKAIRSEKTVFEYHRRRIHYPILGPYIKQLSAWLEEDKHEPKRRQRTAKKLHESLKELGFTGRYETVNAYVKKQMDQKNKSLPQVFIPLSFEPGESFQFDWSEEEIELDGTLTRIKVAHIRLCYSRYFLLIAYPNEQLEMVLDAHDKAFSFFGGTCRQGIYDNMKTAVKQILVGKQREFNPRFLQMASHHCFEPVACTPASGWEKGQVENQVNTVRKNFFTPLVKVKSLDELNKNLSHACYEWAKHKKHPELKDKTVLEVFQTERHFLISYRKPLDAYKVQSSVVSPTSCVMVDTNHYSVDCYYVGKAIEIRIYANKIMMSYQGQEIAQHERCFKRYQYVYNPLHYIPILKIKPGALRHGAPFKQWKLPQPIMELKARFACHPDKDKQFAAILLLIPSEGLERVSALCQKALSLGIYDVSWIKNQLQTHKQVQENYYPQIANMPANCQLYDTVLREGVIHA